MKRKKNWRCSAARAAVPFLVSALLLAPVASAEKKKSKIAREAILFGNVFQESGFILRGARVVVVNADRPKEKKQAVSDIQGEFAVRVPAGKARYVVEVSAEGFAPEKKTVEVTADERLDMTFRLARALK